MKLEDKIAPSTLNNKILFKNNSSNNFRTTFLYNLECSKSEKMKKITTHNNNTKYNKLKLRNKKLFILPDEQKFFSQIKNQKVRNIYSIILKISCKEKEPKAKHLKNIFRLNNSINFLIKSNQGI